MADKDSDPDVESAPDPDAILIDTVTRHIRRLSLAVWCLVALAAVNLCASLGNLLMPYAVVRQINQITHTDAVDALLDQARRQDQYPDFHTWPLQQQIQVASVIVLTRRREDRADGVHCQVSEILKQNRGTEFYYQIGDDYPLCGAAAGNDAPGARDSEGEVLFFIGSPAAFRYSVSYARGKVASLGDMPLSALRKRVADAVRHSQPVP